MESAMVLCGINARDGASPVAVSAFDGNHVIEFMLA